MTHASSDAEGGTGSLADVAPDATQRRAREAALRESERRFRFFVNAVVDYALYMLDTEGHVAAWNPGAERIKGYSAHEILGQHFSCFYTEDDRRAGLPARALETTLREGKFEAEGWRVRKDGSQFWAHVVIDPMHDEGGRLIGFAKITRDMTERRKARQQLERTREALHQAQKMEAIGQLTGGVAHDFNNILAGIVNNLDLARRDVGANPEFDRHIDAALAAARNGAGLIQQMLVFARRQSSQLEAIDVNATLAGLIPFLRRACPENIAVVAALAPDAGFASADPHQLEAALLNLVINARDAMPEGGTVTISSARAAPPASADAPSGDYVCITVADTGVGMSPEVLQHAFEPFFTTKEIGKGTGLGLAMVYGALRQMGGAAAIESEPGRGTAVRLWLPAAAAPERVPGDEAGTKPAPAPKRGAELIFVEDDAIVSMATVEMLREAGYRVHEAARGEKALQLLERHPGVEMLVTDVGLPGMNGHELALESRRRRPGLKVLFITGHDRSRRDERVPAGLETEYLGKPYEPEDLFAALRRLALAA